MSTQKVDFRYFLCYSVDERRYRMISIRLKELRKTLGLSQESFGSKLGVQKSAISKIEKGENGLKEQLFKLICMEFNVNETWLRTGEGQMFNELTREEEIAEYLGDLIAGNNEEVDFQKRFIRVLSKLSVEDWKFIERIVNELANDDNE